MKPWSPPRETTCGTYTPCGRHSRRRLAAHGARVLASQRKYRRARRTAAKCRPHRTPQPRQGKPCLALARTGRWRWPPSPPTHPVVTQDRRYSVCWRATPQGQGAPPFPLPTHVQCGPVRRHRPPTRLGRHSAPTPRAHPKPPTPPQRIGDVGGAGPHNPGQPRPTHERAGRREGCTADRRGAQLDGVCSRVRDRAAPEVGGDTG